LGTLLDTNLSWTLHGKIIEELSTACNLMRNLYYYLIPDSLKKVYFAHFQALLQFEMIFWSSTKNLHKELISKREK
jgi:hypothetical protein